eukprot:1164573-Pyramimonas_sp.AAC.1
MVTLITLLECAQSLSHHLYGPQLGVWAHEIGRFGAMATYRQHGGWTLSRQSSSEVFGRGPPPLSRHARHG